MCRLVVVDSEELNEKGAKMEVGVVDAWKRFHITWQRTRAFHVKYGRYPTEEECKNGLKTTATALVLSPAREYWTSMDSCDGKYEISNWGRVRNVNTRNTLTLFAIKGHYDGASVYVRIKKGKVNVMKEVLKHFGGYDKTKGVTLIDATKPPTLDNIALVIRTHKMKPKEPEKAIQATQDDWLAMGQRIKVYTNRWGRLIRNCGCEKTEIEQSMLCNIMEHWNGAEPSEKQLKRAMNEAIDSTRFSRGVSADTLVIGKNYNI